MASLEQRGNKFRIVFRLGGKKYARALKTREERAAKASLARLEDNLRRIELGNLDAAAQADLWDCAFLTLAEIDELLAHVKANSGHFFLYPMFLFAAHTGARRSEIVRSQLHDIDFVSGTMVIQEKKRVRGKSSTRRVPMSPQLVAALQEWLEVHPGGDFTFCLPQHVVRSKTVRTGPTPLTRDEAHGYFKRALAGSKWSKLRGWHVFRHSFCSNCAAKGLDQRIINAWVGHQTQEMVLRYRHLMPNQEHAAIRAVFGEIAAPSGTVGAVGGS